MGPESLKLLLKMLSDSTDEMKDAREQAAAKAYYKAMLNIKDPEKKSIIEEFSKEANNSLEQGNIDDTHE